MEAKTHQLFVILLPIRKHEGRAGGNDKAAHCQILNGKSFHHIDGLFLSASLFGCLRRSAIAKAAIGLMRMHMLVATEIVTSRLPEFS